MQMTIQSYAKINLGLLVHNKREDGYHNIETVFQLIDLHDTLIFKKVPFGSVQISCSEISIPKDDKNLIHQAFLQYKQALHIRGGLEVTIHKRIPSGAGLGGGSSNAAATLRACESLWKEKTHHHILKRMAFEIGSDVPFFLMGGTALGMGRGEELTPLKIPLNFWVVLVFPGFSVSTGWAYAQTKIGLTNAEKMGKLSSLFNETGVHTWRKTLANQLESVVFPRHPELQRIKMQFYEKDAFYASMSGSGSTMYGLFHDRTKAKSAVQFFSKQKMQALLARPISAHPMNNQDQRDPLIEEG
ncbi:4-(cytidine 5'-diphospho)-2-C-methyl-D-erythritol kinase [bacterium]|nr:4-(cytidine 5'-diphospho)-2-C-methyl-D-erythritol kinase [bacterium]